MEKTFLVAQEYGKVELHLKEIMEKRGLNRAQLSRMIGCHFGVVDRIYSGEAWRLDVDILARLCYVLGCSIEDLLCYAPANKETK